MKISSKALAGVLPNFFNDMLKNENFPDNPKLVDITPGFKMKNLSAQGKL